MASNIVLADAQATPVNHTFVPMGPDKDGVFWFEDQSASSAIGNWRISLHMKRPSVPKAKDNSANRAFRAAITLHEPTLEVISNSTVSGIAPAPTIAYVPRAFVEFVLPERATSTDRKSMRKMLAALLAETQTTALVESLVQPF